MAERLRNLPIIRCQKLVGAGLKPMSVCPIITSFQAICDLLLVEIHTNFFAKVVKKIQKNATFFGFFR
jgi:hypothetical protein